MNYNHNVFSYLRVVPSITTINEKNFRELKKICFTKCIKSLGLYEVTLDMGNLSELFKISTLLEMFGNLQHFFYKSNLKFDDIYDIFE